LIIRLPFWSFSAFFLLEHEICVQLLVQFIVYLCSFNCYFL
jgi:hypothetical protein